MSTKTTFKRIALVAVAALGLGVLTSVAPANAVATVAVPTVGASASYALNTTSITLVDDAASATVVAANAVFGAFEVSLTNANGYPNVLQTGESLTATVIANPNSTVAAAAANAYIALSWASTWTPQTGAATSASYGTTKSIGSADSAYAKDLNLAASLRGGTATTTDITVTKQDKVAADQIGGTATRTYALMVAAADVAALNAGFYTIRIDLLDVNKNAIKSSTVKFQVVTSKVNSGAVVTTTVTGSQLKGAVVSATDIQNITATLADANGGLVRTGANAAPTLSGSITDATLITPLVDALTMTDAGTNADADDAILDGSYVATSTSAAVIAGIAGAATAKVIFGAASATAALVITGTTPSVYMNTSVSATGKVAKTTNFDVPLTTKAATVTATAYNAADISSTGTATLPVGATVMYYTLSYSGCVLGDMLPLAVTTATKVTADANGQYAVAITNANPINGCSATVIFTGAGPVTTVSSTTTASLTRVINWTTPVATSVVVSPAGNYEAVAGSTHKFTWTITDQFSAPIVGSTVQFTMSGANKPATGSSVPSAITDANGQVSYTFTDSAGVPASTTLGTTSVGLSTVGITAFAQGTRTITYKASITAIASLYATYTTTDAATVGVTLTGVVPTTNIGGTTGVLTSAADLLDTTKVVTGTSARPWVKLNFTAKTAAGVATSGVPTTVTVTGAKLIGSDGKIASTVTLYANDDVYVLGTTTGVATVTATNGTLTSTATINFVNAAADARVLKLTEASGLVTASVTDAFGNGVKGVAVDVVGSGGAWLGNGSTSAAFSTATDGTVTFSVTGSGTVSASLSSTTYAKASNLAGAGNSTGTVVTTGAPAGVRSASVATTGYNVTSDSAQAAADAAAEATDAANAATDAANAAAEAADAATAAAQDAADAVAALSTQVSEMVNALKKQITALTNLVIKIQKKVKA